MVNVNEIGKPARRLRRFFRQFPLDPRPEQVHRLRTETRRLEAALAAVSLDSQKQPRRLLKVMTPVRKAAGQVRDIDVLINDAVTLAKGRRSETFVELVEHLSHMRRKRAKRLWAFIAKRRTEARKRLKRSAKLIDKRVHDKSADSVGFSVTPQILVTELCHWPALNLDNLHPFRIRVKELRYMLQLSNHADRRWIRRLGEAKNVIGEWHDWTKLLKIATKVLDPQSGLDTLKQIETIAQKKANLALTIAGEIRKKCVRLASKPKPSTGSRGKDAKF